MSKSQVWFTNVNLLNSLVPAARFLVWIALLLFAQILSDLTNCQFSWQNMISFSSGPFSGVSNSAVSFSWFTSDKLYTESTFFLSNVFLVAFWFGRAFLEALRFFYVFEVYLFSNFYAWCKGRLLGKFEKNCAFQYFSLGCFEGYKLSHAFIWLNFICVRVGIALDAIDLFDNNTWLRVYGSVFPFPPFSPVPPITPAHLFLNVSFRPSAKHLGHYRVETSRGYIKLSPENHHIVLWFSS